MTSGKANGQVSNVLNSTLPTASGGAPGTWTALATGAMKIRVNSGTSSATAAGTELTGTGYTTGGAALGQSTASSGSPATAVTLPATTTSFTNGSGSAWAPSSIDITDSAGTRSWFGGLNGAPLSVAIGNTLQLAANAVSASDA